MPATAILAQIPNADPSQLGMLLLYVAVGLWFAVQVKTLLWDGAPKAKGDELVTRAELEKEITSLIASREMRLTMVNDRIAGVQQAQNQLSDYTTKEVHSLRELLHALQMKLETSSREMMETLHKMTGKILVRIARGKDSEEDEA